MSDEEEQTERRKWELAPDQTTRGRGEVLAAQGYVRACALAKLILDDPEILENVRSLAIPGDKSSIETAIRMSVMRALAPLPYPEGPRLGLAVHLLETALCLIDWTQVRRMIRKQLSSSSPSTIDPPTTPTG